MRPGEYNYTVEGGDCLELYVVLKDGNDNPLVLTGYSSEFTVTWRDESITLSSGSTLEMGEAGESPQNDGSITGRLTGAQTEQLPYGGIAKYEWSVTNPTGCRITFLRGYINRL